MNVAHELLSTNNIGLAWNFHVSPNSCNNPDYYDGYIRFSAIADYKKGMAVTHLLIDKDAGRLIGYISLRATSLVTTSETGKKLVHPALEIAELAVDADYERKGYGSDLVGLAILVANSLRSETLGIRYIMLCADPQAVPFYEKQDFGKLGDLYEALHDGWNDNCEPMYIELPELE